MIIVNQNKDEFVNFDNIMCVNVTNCEEDGYLISAGFIVGRDDNYRKLGYYATKERAEEVLIEIAKTKADWNDYIDNSNDRCIYEMPLE